MSGPTDAVPEAKSTLSIGTQVASIVLMVFWYNDSDGQFPPVAFLQALHLLSRQREALFCIAADYIGFALGGDLQQISPKPAGTTFAPRTRAEELEGEGRFVSSDRWLEMFMSRLGELGKQGIEPTFLVRSIVRYVDDWLESLADTGGTNRKRQQRLDDLQAALADPEQVESYRKAQTDRPAGL